jgi:hypothetical protein
VPREVYAHTATLRLGTGVDPRAVGAAVTVELCGHWEHEGDCRWPHLSEIAPGDPAAFRTVFVADLDEAGHVRARISSALRAAAGWTVLKDGPAEPTVDERERHRPDGPAG